jgi:hypothetical protein
MEALAPAARRLAECGAAVALGWALRRSVFSDVDAQVRRRSVARVASLAPAAPRPDLLLAPPAAAAARRPSSALRSG